MVPYKSEREPYYPKLCALIDYFIDCQRCILTQLSLSILVDIFMKIRSAILIPGKIKNSMSVGTLDLRVHFQSPVIYERKLSSCVNNIEVNYQTQALWDLLSFGFNMATNLLD